MPTPNRIQRRRTKGWRLPANTVCVSRPGKWGNPFAWRDGVEVADEKWARGAAVDLYREWMERPKDFPKQPKPPTIAEIRCELAGKNLACWCPLDSPCHAEVLLQLANS